MMSQRFRTQYVLLVLLASLAYSQSVRLFTVPGVPACYVSSSANQGSPLFKRCDFSNAHCTADNVGRYLYCSTDHYCCSTSDSCPQCCIERDDLNGKEIAGIVIGISIFVFVTIALSVFISVKFCTTRK